MPRIMERSCFSVYKLTSPSGRSYVGYTSQAVSERWRQHVNRARSGARHPLCAAIRKYGADSFIVETLVEYDTRGAALLAEVEAIAELTGAYNLSSGGEDDSAAGVAAFREKLKDPAWREAYGRRLSAALRGSPHYQAKVPELLETLARWREENPTKSYLIAMRNLRIGANKAGRKKAYAEPQRLPRKPNGKAAKFHKSIASREAAKKHWAEMPEDVKEAIAAKISQRLKAHHELKDPQARAAHDRQLSEARKAIDHTVRKARQKEALVAYWTPERRAAFGAKVRARNAAKKGTPDANV